MNWRLVVQKTRVKNKCFRFLVGRWWATMQPVRLTADCFMSVERRQRMIGRPGLIAWRAGQSELLWLTSAGDGGPRRQLPGRYCQRGRTEPGAVPLRQRNVRTQRRNRIRSGTRNQWWNYVSDLAKKLHSIAIVKNFSTKIADKC